MVVCGTDGLDCGGACSTMMKMGEKETSALYQSAVYGSLMLLLVFATVVLWEYVSVYLLLGLPMVYYLFQEEWEEYKRQRHGRRKKEPVSEQETMKGKE